MPQFRKKPLIIEAEQYCYDAYLATGRLPADVCDRMQCGAPGAIVVQGPHVHTLEAVLTVADKDWIIHGVAGEVYPCRADIFMQTYEPVLHEGDDAQEDEGNC
jgi:hypothetical protein